MGKESRRNRLEMNFHKKWTRYVCVENLPIQLIKRRSSRNIGNQLIISRGVIEGSIIAYVPASD